MTLPSGAGGTGAVLVQGLISVKRSSFKRHFGKDGMKIALVSPDRMGEKQDKCKKQDRN